MVSSPKNAVSDTVYLVDQSQQFVDMASRLLRQQGLDVFAFNSPSRLIHRLNPALPSCLVCELRMEGFDGLQLRQQLGAVHHRVPPTIFIGRPGDVAGAVAALKSGAVDFLEHPLRAAALLESVTAALEFDRRQRERQAERAVLAERFDRLTPRESQVFAALLENHSAKEIALQLQISPRTAEHHREGVMRKMKARSWQQLLVMGILLGLYEPKMPRDESAADPVETDPVDAECAPQSIGILQPEEAVSNC